MFEALKGWGIDIAYSLAYSLRYSSIEKDTHMGSGSSTTQLLDARRSSTNEGKRDKSTTEKKSSDRQREQDAILLANKHGSMVN